MTPQEVAQEIGEIHATIAGVAHQQPELVMLAIIDELISVACGTNPALRDIMRLHLYRRIRDRVVRLVPTIPWPASDPDPRNTR